MAQGLARKLLPGFLAIAVFMTGDGFELTFLSKYVVDQGFSSSQASLLFTMYGLVAALAGWSSGVLAELFGAKRIMLIGAGSWIVLHLVFIGVALPSHSYSLMLASYMLRGMGYPLFIYSFVVLLAQTVDPGKLASAMGWFWTSYSFGIGVFGAYLPAFITPVIGEYYSLWVSLPFSIVGMIICLCFVPKTRNANLDTMSSSDKLRELSRGVTILKDNHQIALAAVLRVICNLTLYGFPVIMPLYLATHTNGGGAWYQVTEWSTIWGLLFVVTVFGNVFWGRMGDCFGWMSQMRWWGCWLSALGTLAMYYVPQLFGHNLPFMYVCAVVLGMGISAFVPMGAVFPALDLSTRALRFPHIPRFRPDHILWSVHRHGTAQYRRFCRSVLGICHLLHLWLGHLILDSPRAAGASPAKWRRTERCSLTVLVKNQQYKTLKK